jgi:hypothetical protein
VATIGAALGDLLVTLGRQAVVDVPANIELHNWDTQQPSANHNRRSGSEGLRRRLLLA